MPRRSPFSQVEKIAIDFVRNKLAKDEARRAPHISAPLLASRLVNKTHLHRVMEMEAQKQHRKNKWKWSTANKVRNYH